MTVVLSCDFTNQIQIIKTDNTRVKTIGPIKVGVDSVLADVVFTIESMGRDIESDFAGVPSEIIFNGACGLFRKIEKHYEGKGVQIIWQ